MNDKIYEENRRENATKRTRTRRDLMQRIYIYRRCRRDWSECEL